MSLLSPLAYVIPNDTVCVARAAFPTGNVYMQMHDARGPISTNPQFAALFSHTGQPAADPARLALILVMQFAEGLLDRQATDAVRGRIDWKDASVLNEFRTRGVTGGVEHSLLEMLLTVLQDQGC